jgi:UDP-N-acetylglucosamine acyltransferase
VIDPSGFRAVSSDGFVSSTAIVGERCAVGPCAIVEDGAILGDDCVLEPFARVCAGARVGSRVRLGQGSVVGGAPQHRDWDGAPASCVVGSDSRLGEYATVHGGMRSPTFVGERAMIMAYAHLGHDCRVEDDAVIANGVQLAGHVRIGKGANLGGGTLVHQNVRVGEWAFVAGGLRLDLDVAPWSKVMGAPARWCGTNRLGLERAGWDHARIAAAESALRILFRRGLRLDEAVEVLERGGPQAQDLARFCKEDGRGLVRPAS